MNLSAPPRLAVPDALSALLADFAPITLDELGGAELMNRREAKFTVPRAALPEMLRALHGEYRLLTIAGTPLQGYHSRYYDTADFSMFRAQQQRRTRRHKVRRRTYRSTGAAFLEIKRRDGPVTDKLRVRAGSEADERAFLLEHGVRSESLYPVVDVLCERLTLVRCGAQPERLTLDLNLQLARGERTLGFPGAVIVELKSEGASHHAHFAPFAREFGLKPDRISKYGVAVALHVPQVPSNLVQPQLRLLRRVQEQQFPTSGLRAVAP